MIPALWPYQADVIGRLRGRVSNGSRIVVLQASTGAGKTTIASYMAKSAMDKSRRSLFLVHRRRLVDQISGRLQEFEVEHGVIMRGEAPFGSALVQVASRDTIMSRVFRNEWTGLPPADIVFVDEAHHAADAESDYRKILAHYPKAVIVLLTATPVGPDGKGLGPWANAIECAASTSQLVRDGFLVPVKCYAPDRKLHRSGKAKRGIAGDLVQSWKDFAEGKPTVLYVSRVQHSLDAVAAFNEAGIPAAHIDANTTDEERDRIFEAVVRGEILVISNVGILLEGVDIPCLACCQLYMDVGGRVKFIQAVGRIMRAFAGKKYGILIDHAGSVFRHGFPDEDTEWTLEGNADDDFKKKHDAGQTKKANYCRNCELLFNTLACPQCGRQPVKPPKSIFAPPPVDSSDELLTEAERAGAAAFSLDEKIKHWIRCLHVAANKSGSFGMAAQIYKRKFSEWPGKEFPDMPSYNGWKQRVADVYPKFKRSKR